MISSTTWAARGYASEFPEEYELDNEEMERIAQFAQLQIDDAKEGIKTLEKGEKQDDEENDSEESHVQTTKLLGEGDIDDDLKEYDLEHYDDDQTEGEAFSVIPGLSNEIEFHDGNEDGSDPYITLPDEEDVQQEKQESHIYPTDNLVLATRTEDDVSYLDVYVYDDGAGAPPGAPEEEEDKQDPDVAKGLQRDSSLYVHHDIMLPAFPLTVEWINYRPNNSNEDKDGNLVAIGTFDPHIEIWNLDCMEKSFPDLILGELTKKDKQKKKKKKKTSEGNHVTTHHTDAVLSLAHNKYHRNVLASTSADHTVKLWDLNSAAAVRSMSEIHSHKNVSSSQWHKSEASVLLTGGYDGRVAITDVRISKESEMSKFWSLNPTQDIEAVQWATQEQFLAGTDQGNVYCFDIRNEKKPLWTLQSHDAGISSLEVNNFIPDLLITSAMGEKHIKLWKIPTESNKASGPSMVLSRDFGVGNILTSSFAPDLEVAGNIVIGGVNKGLKLFDVFSNASVRNSFKHQLKALQATAREEASANGRSSRIARKYQSNTGESIIEAESDGEKEDDQDDDDWDNMDD